MGGTRRRRSCDLFCVGRVDGACVSDTGWAWQAVGRWLLHAPPRQRPALGDAGWINQDGGLAAGPLLLGRVFHVASFFPPLFFCLFLRGAVGSWQRCWVQR